MKELHDLLSKQGVRLFDLTLGVETTTFIHPSKTVEVWRQELRGFISELQDLTTEDGRSDDEIHNALFGKLRNAGYIEVTDVVSDVYEGRIAVNSASICDDPSHDSQSDGFGHYGWESKKEL
jgi:hypothetical protein